MRTVCLPGHIQKGGTTNVDASNAHAMKVVEFVLETLGVSTVSESRLPPVVLKRGIEECIVGWVAIGELVEEDGVEGDGPPVRRGRGVGGVGPGRGVVEHGLRALVGIEVVGD